MSTRSHRLQSSSRRLALTSIVVFSLSFAGSAFADAIPYYRGAIAPQVTTYAPDSSGVNVYFYGRGDASYIDYVRIYDVNTGFNSGDFFNNQLTATGTELTIGNSPGQIDAGDRLIFYINSPAGLFASDRSYSADGVNHGYITPYSGGLIGSSKVPSGTFIGMEDMAGGGDESYYDDEFVLTGSSDSPVGVSPEPSPLWLIGTGILGLAATIRQRLTVS